LLALLLACLSVLIIGCDGGDVTEENLPPDDEVNTPDDGILRLYVSSEASDGGDGSADAPFASVEEARDKIREIKEQPEQPSGIEVIIADGLYDMSAPIKFDRRDSGSESCPITYTAQGSGAIFSGKHSLEGVMPLNEAEQSRLEEDIAGYVRKIKLPDNFEDTFIYADGVRLEVSRYPNVIVGKNDHASADAAAEKWLNIEGVFEKAGNWFGWYSSGQRGEEPSTGVYGINDAVAEYIREKNWTIGDGLAAHISPNSWYFYDAEVRSIDFDRNRIEFASITNYDITYSSTYYFINIFEEIDLPGEYYIDRESGTLYFYPPVGCGDDCVITFADYDSQHIIIAGAEYLTFRNLTFEYSNSDEPMISCTSSNCTFDGLVLRSGMGSGILGDGYNITVKNCDVSDFAANGIYIRGGNSENLVSSGNRVTGNNIYNWSLGGKVNYAVYIDGTGNLVDHNEIHDSMTQSVYYSGPLNIIEYNEIYNVCLKGNDNGAIYSGRSYDYYGSEVRFNLIYDVGDPLHPGGMSHGIYIDDCLSGQTVYGNIIINTSSWAVMCGGGRDNIIENNLIINCGRAGVQYDQRGRQSAFFGDKKWVDLPCVGRRVRLFRNEIWDAAFPSRAKIETNYSSADIDNPYLMANPSFSSVKNNFVYSTPSSEEMRKHYTAASLRAVAAERDVEKFSLIGDNFCVVNELFADVVTDEGYDISRIDFEKITSELPDFVPIDINEIGRGK